MNIFRSSDCLRLSNEADVMSMSAGKVSLCDEHVGRHKFLNMFRDMSQIQMKLR